MVWIEQLLATEPVPDDLVSAWFDKPVADRMILAGISTIGAMQERIRERRYRLWLTVPKLGEKGAARFRAAGKLLPRERVEMLLDPATPFLELSPLAAEGMYNGESPAALCSLGNFS